jgi:hypothetical protein
MATLKSGTTIGGNTPITSANISSQSVTYASTAGSAPANGGTSAACSGNAATATSAGSATSAGYATSAGSATTLTGNWTSMPAGTIVLFRQSNAPTGWTKDTTNYNEHALRVVTGTAGSGGSVNFTTAFASQGVSGSVGGTGASGISGTADAMTLTEAQMPSHTHTEMGSVGGINIQYRNDGGFSIGSCPTGATGGSSSHSHSVSGGSHSHTSGVFSGTAINMAVKYVDIILASKN